MKKKKKKEHKKKIKNQILNLLKYKHSLIEKKP
jgi:hypothetical protein